MSLVFDKTWDDNIIAVAKANKTRGIKNILPLPKTFSTITTPIANLSIK